MTMPTAIPQPAQSTLVQPFPSAGPRIRQAYRELDQAANGTPAQIRALGELNQLSRPWDPGTCTSRELRKELWAWLDDVVTWLNHEYSWDVTDMIPSCWPQHPHLVHEIAVLGDQRRIANTALTSDRLEDWHRNSLPQFTDRLRTRTRNHCDDGHQPWPAKSRHTRHLAPTSTRERTAAFDNDANSQRRSGLRIGVVDLNTGEITET